MAVTQQIDPGGQPPVRAVWLAASERLLEWDDGFHELLLGDRVRMRAFHAAIDEVVQPGMTVLDLGTGTGILAEWALEKGAARVYGLELNENLLAAATERLGASGHGASFKPVHGLSLDVTLPEAVDVIVSETLGNLADNKGRSRSSTTRAAGSSLPAGRCCPSASRATSCPSRPSEHTTS